MTKISAIEKLALVKETAISLGINIDSMTVAEAYNIFLAIEKKITWYQFMATCRTIVNQ